MDLQLINIFWIITVVSGTFLDVKPKDTWALLGSDAIIACTINLQTEGQYVFWKRVHTAGTEVITSDNQTLNAKKYEIQGTYNLVIKNVELEDEGHYELDTGEERVQISLSVTVSMQNMTITWGGSIPFSHNSEANITCNASNSRPAANLRWLLGTHDVTYKASTNIKITRADGYGDSISILKTVIGSVDVPYLCIADLPGHKAVRKEIAFPPVIGGSALSCSHNNLLLILLGVCSSLLNFIIVKPT